MIEKDEMIFTRVPPGDNWSPVDDPSTVLTSLTNALDAYFVENGTRKFFIDAAEGAIYAVVETTNASPKYSIYGDYPTVR